MTAMQNPVEFPLDVLGYIADMMGADVVRSKQWDTIDWDSFNALKMLSLTCKSMVPVCRRHLFAIIRFPCSHRSLERQEGLSKFLLTHSTIRLHYFKNLYINDVCESDCFGIADYAFLNSICHSSSLSSIEISAKYPCNWDDNFKVPDKAKSAILSLIQMPTLRYLTFNQIDNFPATLLSRCSGLKELVLHEIINLIPPGANNAMRAKTLTSLVSLASHSRSDGNNSGGVQSLMHVTPGHRQFLRVTAPHS